MNKSDDILRFLLKKKISIRLAIEILEKAEGKLKEKWKAQEKAVLPGYQTR